MTEPERPVIELPRFSDEIRTSVPGREDASGDFEVVLETWIARFNKARAAARYEERRLHETGLVTARRQGVYILAAAAIRILDLGAGIILLVNARRAHAAFAVARALFETSASLSYLDQEVLPRLAKAKVEQVAETLSRIRVGLDPGVGLDDDEGAMPMPIPVGSMIKALARQADTAMPVDETQEQNDDEAKEESAGEMMSRSYSVLSDHAHPNQSAGHLSSSSDETNWMMDWTFDHVWDESTTHLALDTTYLALRFAGEAFDRFMAALTEHPLVLADKRGGPSDLTSRLMARPCWRHYLPKTNTHRGPTPGTPVERAISRLTTSGQLPRRRRASIYLPIPPWHYEYRRSRKGGAE